MIKCAMGVALAGGMRAFASPKRSAVAARHIVGGAEAPWTNPYDHDGMLEFWDAEWNGGGGVHDSSSSTCLPLVDGGAVMEFGSNSVLRDNYVDCTSGGGLIVADCPNLISATDNRRVAFPRTIVWCMRFNAYKQGGRVIRLGLTGNDTSIYSMDGYNVKWVFLGSQYDGSGMSPADNVLATIGVVAVSGDIRLYINGTDQRVSTNTFLWCIGGGLAFLCNAAFDSNVVNGMFYNAMMYDHGLTTAELDAIHAINQTRFGA